MDYAGERGGAGLVGEVSIGEQQKRLGLGMMIGR